MWIITIASLLSFFCISKLIPEFRFGLENILSKTPGHCNHHAAGQSGSALNQPLSPTEEPLQKETHGTLFPEQSDHGVTRKPQEVKYFSKPEVKKELLASNLILSEKTDPKDTLS